MKEINNNYEFRIAAIVSQVSIIITGGLLQDVRIGDKFKIYDANGAVVLDPNIIDTDTDIVNDTSTLKDFYILNLNNDDVLGTISEAKGMVTVTEVFPNFAVCETLQYHPDEHQKYHDPFLESYTLDINYRDLIAIPVKPEVRRGDIVVKQLEARKD